MAVKNVSTKKKSKKAWVSVYAPDIFNKAFLGESYVYGKEELIGKTLNLNLSTFTNDMKKQNMNVFFKISGVHEGKGQAEVIGLILSQAYIKRLVRRGKNKIEDSFLAKTNDQKTVRIKPIMITNAKAHQSVVSRLRLEAKAHIKRMLKNHTVESFIKELTDLKIQKEIRDKLQKIYPLKYFDVRQVVLEKDKVVVDELIAETEELSDETIDEDLEGLEESEESDELEESYEEDIEESEEDLDESDEEESIPPKTKAKK